MKQILIIKDSSSKVKIHKEYLEISTIYENRVIGLRHIKELYINQLIQIVPSQYIKLCDKFDIFFINQRGEILGRIQKESYEKV